MRRRELPPAEPPPVDRSEILRLLYLANEARERGVNLHHHPLLEELAEAAGKTLAVYVFAFCPDDRRLSAAELDRLADGLCRR